MMKNLYAMRDIKQGFLTPFTEIKDDIAMRNFDVACKRNEIVYFNPADFSLWKIGQMDDDSGVLYPLDPPIWMMDAIDHRKDDNDD